MKRFIIFVIVLIIGGIFLSQQVLALTISPVKFEISGEPGQELLGEIILYNEEVETKTFYSSSGNFEARGEGGTPHFIPGIEGLAAWITAPAQVVLEPGERKTIPFNIQIPKDADPGGHFAAILWSTAPPQPQEGGQIMIGAKVGTLVLLRVTGEIEERGALLEFGTKDNQAFFNSLPITFVYRFQNEGSDRVKPEGEIKIRNMLGMTETILSANPKEGNVLPQSIRKFEIVWGEIQNNKQQETGDKNMIERFFQDTKREWNNFAIGRYTAELSFEFGVTREKAQANFSFWVIPWRIMTLTLLIMATVVFLFIIGIKRYNQWIISKFKAKSISPPILKEEKEQKDGLKKKQKQKEKETKEKIKKRKIKKRVKKETKEEKEEIKEKVKKKKTKNKNKIKNRKRKKKEDKESGEIVKKVKEEVHKTEE